ncbi:alpha/beta hydrolase [Sphingomonas sp.]|uniref:alpha/beta hydrolase n=1 Tax=Sphingomonas sp. TaxID=28214 RepID=UPI002C2288C6|nr:alpha/beta hydrolase [Sphingomonas sp.]HWK35331.1 alpha/beta hydrolase [Sphingomonas sp.]
MIMRLCGALALALAITPAPGTAQDGIVQVPAFALPPSNQLSDEAKAVLLRMKAESAPDLGGDVARQRAFYQDWNDRRLAEMRRAFATSERHATMGGVGVDIVTPRAGVSARHRGRVLINVHGGAFMWGAGSGALVEAIPIAATMGIKVVTVDYRLTPEHRYPAASEDVTAVYRELLKTYPAQNIGIYGCSAGGVITAQSVAWIGKQGLPRPGAIGTFCGTAAAYSGDSPILAGPIAGQPPLPVTVLPPIIPSPYLADVAISDPLAYPLVSDAQIKAFPPTLLLAGGRDFAVSALTLAHRRLRAAGIDSELFVFDGLPHAFFMWPDMPESVEAYATIARFFDAHLGTESRGRAR